MFSKICFSVWWLVSVRAALVGNVFQTCDGSTESQILFGIYSEEFTMAQLTAIGLCESKNGVLASIRSKTEMENIVGVIDAPSQSGEQFWVGVQEKTPRFSGDSRATMAGKFGFLSSAEFNSEKEESEALAFVHSIVDPTPWHSGDPRDIDQDCARLRFQNQVRLLADIGCDGFGAQIRGYICRFECPSKEPTQTPTSFPTDPTSSPTTLAPTFFPTDSPTTQPTSSPLEQSSSNAEDNVNEAALGALGVLLGMFLGSGIFVSFKLRREMNRAAKMRKEIDDIRSGNKLEDAELDAFLETFN